MTTWDLVPYAPSHAADWDRLVEASPGGTVMQSQRFLGYHGTRFRDLSLLGYRAGKLQAVLPMAAASTPGRAVSHPGTSFGGVITPLRDPAHARAFLSAASVWLQGQDFTELLYNPPPAAVLPQPDDGLLPDLLRLGTLTGVDLCAVVTLPGPERGYWQGEIRRAERKGLTAHPVTTSEAWAELHALLSARLSGKYGKAPVHSPAELVDLHARLGPQSRAQIIRDPSGAALAAQWFIDYGTGVLHNQYNGATDAGLALGAASYGISLALEAATQDGFRTFSFGRSTNDDGWTENRALQRFKSGFGAGLAAQHHILLPLDRLAALRD